MSQRPIREILVSDDKVRGALNEDACAVETLQNSEMSEMRCSNLCEMVQNFAYTLSNRYVYDEEMPRELIHISRVTNFVGKIGNGNSLGHIFDDPTYSHSWGREVVEAFKAIGALGHATVWGRMVTYVQEKRRAHRSYQSLNDKAFISLLAPLEKSELSAAKLADRFGTRAIQRDRPDALWTAPKFLCAKYILGLPNIRFIASDDEYSAAFEKAVDLVPQAAERKRAHDEALRIVDVLLASAGLKSFGFWPFSLWEYDGTKCWPFHVSTSNDRPKQGHHAAIFFPGRAILVHGTTKAIVAETTVPTGGYVTKNQS